MGEPKQTRLTKNSQRIASLEDQNRVLEEVLRASREAGGKNKDKSEHGNENTTPGKKDHNPPKEDELAVKKRKAKPTVDSPPAKKAKTDGEQQSVGGAEEEVGVEKPKRGLILEYPDYEGNRESDFDEGRLETSYGNAEGTAGKTGTSSVNRRQHVTRTELREHEISSEEEDDLEDYKEPVDDQNDDFLGSGDWDGRSISSSVIFPSHGRRSYDQTKSYKARPEASEARSRSGGAVNNNTTARSQDQDRGNNPEGGNSIEDLVKSRAGVVTAKDSVGPPVSDCIAELLKAYLKEPNAESVSKLLEDYPRPANAEWLQAPTMGPQVAASIPKKSNNYDKRLRQSQLYVGGSLAAMASVLQDIMYRGKHDSSLLELARKVMDAMALSGYVHADFNAIRKGAIRQVVNPSYAGVFTRRTSSTPENLLGESSVPEQLKEYEEINKVRAKLQKPKRGGHDGRQDNRGRGRGYGSGGHRGGFSNRPAGNNHGSGFGNYHNNFPQRGARGSRPGYPQQRRVYGHNHQNVQDQNNHGNQKNV